MNIKNLIGHRGFAGLRPENTLCGFSFAAEFGLAMVEFDVQLSKDDQWVLLHDATLERTTDMQGRVTDYTLAELTQIEAGLWFTPPYPQQYIPSLLQTLELTNSLGLTCNIEIKGSNKEPQKHARLLADFLNTFRGHSQPIVSSFDVACLTALRQLSPTTRIAYLVEEFAPDTIKLCHQFQFESINCEVHKFTAANLVAATTNQLPVYLYTINDQATANYWLDQGVAGIFTDRADLLL